MKRRALATSLLLGFAPAGLAHEAAVRRMIEEKVRGAGQLEAVRKAPWGNLYEVVVRGPDGPQIFYVDSKASVIIAGQAIDAKSGRNITEERLQKLSAIKWESLPFDSAITTTRGAGRRKIAVFSDPNCPYCKRFEKDLAKLDDITVHVFLYPVIRPESVALTKSVWCSQDRGKAWNDLMLRDVEPSATGDCDTPVERLVALGRKLGASSTPTWFLENGERGQGAETVRKFFGETDIRSLQLFIDPSAQAAFKLGAPGVPSTLLVDRAGREVGRHAGPAKWDAPEVVEDLARRMKEAGGR